jgi:hypothetical protein
MQRPSASARTQHRRLLFVPVLFNNIEHAIDKRRRQVVRHNLHTIGWISPIRPKLRYPLARIDEPRANTREQCINPLHAFRLSASSIIPSSGLVSPKPTLAPRISQIPSSGSVMISMLAKEKMTLANVAFGSSRKG